MVEGIWEKYFDKEWLQVMGLIYDFGKVMVFWGEFQFFIVGDIFVVGCVLDDSIVFGCESFKDNLDMYDEKLNMRLGIYEENCGLDKVLMLWGYDEYMYWVLMNYFYSLLDEVFYIICFYLFYFWYISDVYFYLCNNKDMEMKKWVLEFN